MNTFFSRYVSRSACLNQVSRIAFLGRSLLLGVGASLLFYGEKASALDTITLRYTSPTTGETSQIEITLDEIERFSETGELSQEFQEFFDISLESAPRVRQVLTEEILIPATAVDDAEKFLDSSTGEFVTLQLDKLLQGSSDLEALRVAIRTSILDDRTISLLELLQNYSGSDLDINLTGLVRTYTEVKAFVERILPALEVAREYIQDIVCECEDRPAAEDSDSPQSALPGSVQAANCVDTQTTIAPAAPAPAPESASLSVLPVSHHQPESGRSDR